jgi:hypothetical protein
MEHIAREVCANREVPLSTAPVADLSPEVRAGAGESTLTDHRARRQSAPGAWCRARMPACLVCVVNTRVFPWRASLAQGCALSAVHFSNGCSRALPVAELRLHWDVVRFCVRAHYELPARPLF